MVRATHIKTETNSGIFSIKAVLRYCFIFLICFVFATLKFSAFIYASQSGVLVKKHLAVRSLPAEQPSFTSGSPIAPFSGEPDMEVMEEDEETKTKTDHSVEVVYLNHSSDEQLFSSFLKSRYLHKEFALHNRQAIPFFVLYHSWKSYLG